MGTGRTSHCAVLLPGGEVLVAGGIDKNSAILSSAELFDPASGTFAATGPMGAPRTGHTATLLPNDMVLIAGGFYSGSPRASAELYDLTTGIFTPTGSMAAARGHHVAVLLASGKVLVAGGEQLASAEVYDPASGTFSPAGSMGFAREFPAAILLPTRKVLIAGGENLNDGYLSSAELYEPATGLFSPAAPMARKRSMFASALLPGGTVLVAGGTREVRDQAEAELFSIRSCKCGDPAQLVLIDGVPPWTASTAHTVELDSGFSTGVEPLAFAWAVAGAGAIVGPPDGRKVEIASQGPGSVHVTLTIRDGGCSGRTASATANFEFALPPATWVRCDADHNAALDITDVIKSLSYQFLGDTAPQCLSALDCDGSGILDITDPFFIINFLFTNGGPPASPFPMCEAFEGCSYPTGVACP
jgi:galactose oxidase-like protein